MMDTSEKIDRRTLARMGGLAYVAKYGTKQLSQHSMDKRMTSYERKADEAYPGLRERDPREFAKQALAMQNAHLALMRERSLESRRKKKAAQEALPFACSWCCKERKMAFPSNATERTCTKHIKSWSQSSRRQMAQRRAAGLTAAQQVGLPLISTDEARKLAQIA